MTARLDRYGEPLPEELLEPPPIHRCNDGWLDDDAEGRPTPCGVCRAPTVRRLHAQRTRDWLEPPRSA